jgi:hypothetical protein
MRRSFSHEGDHGRIPYPDAQKLPPEVRNLLSEVTNLNIFRMWAHSINKVGLVAQLGATQFAKLELPTLVCFSCRRYSLLAFRSAA